MPPWKPSGIPQKRTGPSHPLRFPRPGSSRHLRLHRGLLQPRQAQLRRRISTAASTACPANSAPQNAPRAAPRAFRRRCRRRADASAPSARRSGNARRLAERMPLATDRCVHIRPAVPPSASAACASSPAGPAPPVVHHLRHSHVHPRRLSRHHSPAYAVAGWTLTFFATLDAVEVGLNRAGIARRRPIPPRQPHIPSLDQAGVIIRLNLILLC